MKKKSVIRLFAVVAYIVFSAGCSTPPPEPPPSPPSKVSATLTGGFKRIGNLVLTKTQDVSVSWEPVPGADSYTVYWDTTKGVSKGSTLPIRNVPNPYIHTRTEEGKTYYYVVTASKKDKESTESQEVSATPHKGALQFGISGRGLTFEGIGTPDEHSGKKPSPEAK